MDFQLEKFKEFEEKSNKEKCVLMWEWIVKEKSCSKSQFFVSKFGINSLYGAHLFPFNSCYACAEVRPNGEMSCEFCPIKWVPGRGKLTGACEQPLSPYAKWMHIPSSENAQKVLNCIKETWKE